MTDRDSPLLIAFLTLGMAIGLALGMLPLPAWGSIAIIAVLGVLTVGLVELWRRG